MRAPRIPSPSKLRRPTVTKTFLFSDLRSYTAFVERVGDEGAADLLRAYRNVLRVEIARYRGAEIKTEGDSFYVVFDAASRAVLCAAAIQRSVSAHNASHPDQQLGVGIGVHSGETIAFDRQYVGSAVNVASRLASRADAGEILISDTLRGLVRTGLPVGLADRGALELKGVSEPVRAWSVDWQGGSGEVEAPGRDVLGGLLRDARARLAVAALAIVLVIVALARAIAVVAPAGPAATASAPAGTTLPAHGALLFELDASPGGARRLAVVLGSSTADSVAFFGDRIEITVSPGSTVSLSVVGLAPDDLVAECGASIASGQGTYALWLRGADTRQVQVQLNPSTGELFVRGKSSVTSAPDERLFGPASRLPPTDRDERRIIVSAHGRDLAVYDSSAREIARAVDPTPAAGGVGFVVSASRDRAVVVQLRALRVYGP